MTTGHERGCECAAAVAVVAVVFVFVAFVVVVAVVVVAVVAVAALTLPYDQASSPWSPDRFQRLSSGRMYHQRGNLWYPFAPPYAACVW